MLSAVTRRSLKLHLVRTPGSTATTWSCLNRCKTFSVRLFNTDGTNSTESSDSHGGGHEFVSNASSPSEDSIHDMVSQEILSNPTLSSPIDYTESEQKIYDIVKQLIANNLIDLPELYQIATRKRSEVEALSKELVSGGSQGTQDVSQDVSDDAVTLACLSKPLEFWFDNRRAPGKSFVSEECELKLDDRDIKHILVYLLKDHLITDESRLARARAWRRRRRELEESLGIKMNEDVERARELELEFRAEYEENQWRNVHPWIKELASLYNIKTLHGFRHFAWQISDHSSYTTAHILTAGMEKFDANKAHVVARYDALSPVLSDKLLDSRDENSKYDEFGQRRDQLQRDMTSHELDVTMKRIQDLEYLQEILQEQDDDTLQSVARGPEEDLEGLESDGTDASDAEAQVADATQATRLNVADPQDELSVAITAAKQGRKKRGPAGDLGESLHFEKVLNKIGEKWDHDLRGAGSMAMKTGDNYKYLGGDWRVRLGIKNKPPKPFDMEREMERQWEEQLEQGLSCTVKNRYKKSPYKIKGLPYDDMMDINIDFRNVKFLSKFVNNRGMIIPARMTGMNRKHQKKIDKAIRRACQMGLMPFRTKLVFLDKKKIFEMREAKWVANKRYEERDIYDPMTREDLARMYPEFAHNIENNENNGINGIDGMNGMNGMNGNDVYEGYETECMGENGEFNFKTSYGISDEELQFQDKFVSDESLFEREIKQEIMQKIPQYWRNRIKIRNEHARRMEERLERKRQRLARSERSERSERFERSARSSYQRRDNSDVRSNMILS